LQVAFDRGDIDIKVIQHTSGPAAKVQCEDREQVLGANLRRGTVRVAGCGLDCGGI
jgi:hypothetical protein